MSVCCCQPALPGTPSVAAVTLLRSPAVITSPRPQPPCQCVTVCVKGLMMEASYLKIVARIPTATAVKLMEILPSTVQLEWVSVQISSRVLRSVQRLNVAFQQHHHHHQQQQHNLKVIATKSVSALRMGLTGTVVTRRTATVRATGTSP